MTEMKKRIAILPMALVCLALACNGAFAADLVYEPASHEAAMQVSSEPVDLGVRHEEEVFHETESGQGEGLGASAQQNAEKKNVENRYRIVYFDLEGNEIMHEYVREGDAVHAPALIPYREGFAFRYWYDLFTYDQKGEPVPFAFGGVATKNLNLVPYYHYEQTTVGSSILLEYGERMVDDVSEQLIFDILLHDVQDGNAGLADIPSVMRDEDAKALIVEILGTTTAILTQADENETTVMTTEQADALVQDVLGGELVMEEPETQEPTPTVFHDEITMQIIESILDESFVESIEEDDAADADRTVMSKEQVNSLINQILEEQMLENVTAEPTEPKVTEMVYEPETMPQIIDESTNELPVSGEPRVEVVYSYDGDLVPGTSVTVTANVINVDPSLTLTYEWENNASGEFQHVLGATGRSFTFIADETNTACEWRVYITTN